MDEKRATPQWLQWARQIQAQGQNGLAYNDNLYDRQRYRQMLDIAAEIVAQYTDLDAQTALDGFSQQVGYATPKVGVRGAVIRGQDEPQVLLVQERIETLLSSPSTTCRRCLTTAPTSVCCRKCGRTSPIRRGLRHLIKRGIGAVVYSEIG